MALLGLSFAVLRAAGRRAAAAPRLRGKFALLAALLAPEPISARAWALLALLTLAGLAAVIAMGRAGVRIFWAAEERSVPRVRVIEIAPIAVLLALCFALTRGRRAGDALPARRRAGAARAAAATSKAFWAGHEAGSFALLAALARSSTSRSPRAHVLLGAVLALGGVAVYSRLQPPPTACARRSPRSSCSRWCSSTSCARTSRWRASSSALGAGKRTAGFLSMPLELRHPGGLAVLACIITATPGTTWARYDRAAGVVTIHVLDLVDEQAWIRLFKERYERRLLEIFE